MMTFSQFIDFVHNVALLLSVGILYDTIYGMRKRKHALVQDIVTGLAFSLIGVIVMSTPWEFAPGYFFDPRTVLMSVTGLFFGYITAGISMVLLALFRVYQGGGGVVPGMLWVILPCLSGLLWRKIRPWKEKDFGIAELYAYGIIVHIIALGALFSLPFETALLLISNVALPVLLIFPAGTALLGGLLALRQARWKNAQQVTRLATVIEQLNEKIMITNLKGEPVYLNRFFEKSTGYSIDEVLGKKLGQFKSHRQNDEFYRDLWKTISSGGTWRGRIVNQRKDRTLYYDEATIFPIINEEGEIINYASFQRDITDQIHMIDALESSEKNLKTILNSIGDAVIACDAEGAVFNMNPPAQELTGWSLAEATGKSIGRILNLHDSLTGAPVQSDPVSSVLEGDILGKTYAHLKIISHKDEHIPVSLSGAPISGEDNVPSGVVLVIRDITEETKMREMMVQNEKMLSIGGLAAGMAHEINNPLAGMMQSAEVIASRMGGSPENPSNISAAEQAGLSLEALSRYMEERGIYRMLKSIKTSGKKAAKIIENMISFSQSGEEERTTCNIIEIIENTLPILKNDLEVLNAEVRVLSEDSPLLLVCERSKIQQVLINIIRNSLQAFEEAETADPQITIEIKSEREKSVQIDIRDNGPGMSRETSRHVLEPFYSTKDIGSGTGLGLSVSYYIITEEHGGEMSVHSTPGGGTLVSISLPR